MKESAADVVAGREKFTHKFAINGGRRWPYRGDNRRNYSGRHSNEGFGSNCVNVWAHPSGAGPVKFAGRVNKQATIAK